MMLVVVPASTWAIVTTAGSKTSTRRVTIVWSAEDDLGGDRDRVDRLVRRRRVAAAPADRQADEVGGDEHRGPGR